MFNAKTKYKGLPLVSSKNEIYYGNMQDSCVAYLQILSTKEQDGEQIADKINVMLLSTDTTLEPKDRVMKQSVKIGLYNSLDYAAILLERALANSAG